MCKEDGLECSKLQDRWDSRGFIVIAGFLMLLTRVALVSAVLKKESLQKSGGTDELCILGYYD